MLGETGKLGILTGTCEDRGVACSDRTASLTLERVGHDRSPAALGSGADEFVNELDKLIRKADGDLLAHPIMVPDWYQYANAGPIDAVAAEVDCVARYAPRVGSSAEQPGPVEGTDAAAVRDPLAVPEAVIDARRRPMSERLELALNWNTVASELRAGLAAVRRGTPADQ